LEKYESLSVGIKIIQSQSFDNYCSNYPIYPVIICVMRISRKLRSPTKWLYITLLTLSG